MKNIAIKTVALALTILITDNVTAAEQKSQWRLKAKLCNTDVYNILCSQDGKKLITKEYNQAKSHWDNLDNLPTEWDLATFTPTKKIQKKNTRQCIIFDEKGNKVSHIKNVQKNLSAFVDENEQIIKATFASNGKQLVILSIYTDTRSKKLTLWEYIPQSEQLEKRKNLNEYTE